MTRYDMSTQNIVEHVYVFIECICVCLKEKQCLQVLVSDWVYGCKCVCVCACVRVYWMCGSKCVCVCKGWSVSVCVSGCSCVHSNEVCRWYSGINTAALVMPLHYPPYLPLTPLLTPSVHLFLYLHIRLFLSPPLPHCYYPSFTVAYITLYLPSYTTPHSL